MAQYISACSCVGALEQTVSAPTPVTTIIRSMTAVQPTQTKSTTVLTLSVSTTAATSTVIVTTTDVSLTTTTTVTTAAAVASVCANAIADPNFDSSGLGPWVTVGGTGTDIEAYPSPYYCQQDNCVYVCHHQSKEKIFYCFLCLRRC